MQCIACPEKENENGSKESIRMWAYNDNCFICPDCNSMTYVSILSKIKDDTQFNTE